MKVAQLSALLYVAISNHLYEKQKKCFILYGRLTQVGLYFSFLFLRQDCGSVHCLLVPFEDRSRETETCMHKYQNLLTHGSNSCV